MGELIIEILGWSSVIGWFVFLLIFIIKKPEISNLSIGIGFTLTYKIIGQIILLGVVDLYYYGFIWWEERIPGFFINVDWLLIPIIAFISGVIRRIKRGKASPDLDVEPRENNLIRYRDSGDSKNNLFIGIVVVIVMISIIYGISLGN